MNSLHRYILGAVGLAAMVAVFWFFGDIVFYVLIAGVLAIMCQPLVSKVTGVKVFGRNLPRWVGAVAGVVSVGLVILLFFVLLIPLISGKVNDLTHLDYSSMLASLREPMAELGLFLEKYPHLEMVSFGPTIRGVHSPDERLEISTVDKFWRLLCDVVKSV